MSRKNKWQWAYREKYEKAGITALLGSGFDPGVTSVFSAYALKHYFDEINYIDILDCNGGDHGYPFATNFNPEINIREVSAKGSYWEDGHWVETEPMEIKREYDFPEVGKKDMYLLHHEEIESLALNIPGIKRIRFFMTFGQSYLTHLKCLENVTHPLWDREQKERPISDASLSARRMERRKLFISTIHATIRNVIKRWDPRQWPIRRACRP